jgi:CRISPR-associated protein Cmr2
MVDHSGEFLFSFSVGPVQDFIASARTTRDLWTGSRLLSDLSEAAIQAVTQIGGKLVFPSIEGDDLPESIPNTFVACLPKDAAAEAARKCLDAANKKWLEIAEKVRSGMQQNRSPAPGWDEGWDRQIKNFWDIRTASVPVSAGEDPSVLKLLGPGHSGGFPAAMAYLQRLAGAQKQIRHYPPHEPGDQSEKPETRPKCSLLGTLAQMGPISPGNQMATSAGFWSSIANTSLNGTRLGRADRLCAVSLVKRFAWAFHYRELERNISPFPDIDTVCATYWLTQSGVAFHQQNGWSGHWLRWEKNLSQQDAAAEGEDPCPANVWSDIQRAKKDFGRPPAYYAVLALDGDGIGGLLANCARDGYEKISSALTAFAAGARNIIQDHLGTLIYAGGDDVLAMLPTATAVDCACALSKSFNGLKMPGGQTPTVSAGLVVAHYKENLRLVLTEARRAEAFAKREGRNRFALSVMRRSGEHAAQACLWELAPTLQELVRHFRDGATDRWAYALRTEMAAINSGPHGPAMLGSELSRLLARSQQMPREAAETIQKLWKTVTSPAVAAKLADGPEQFIGLVQSAAFLARVPKE